MPKEDEKKKKSVKNLDDLMESMRDEHSKDLDASFKAWDNFTKEENQNHLYNNVFTPAQDKLYDSIKGELDKVFGKDGGDETKVLGKKKEIRKAIGIGIKEYFKGVHPSYTKFMDDLKLDEDDQYDMLVKLYDDHIGAGKIKGVRSISQLEALTRDKKATVGHIKKEIHERGAEHIKGAMGMMENQYITHHFSKYRGPEIAAYLKPHIEKAGFEIEDKLGYAISELGELLKMREAVVEKKGHPYLTKKKEEPKKK
ncbi:hypothetical protein HYT55_05760 [Candidatus Woesearchaeota archaeon]|nr:hypothetical protein [Candidatus Woesearchaeota archaeon]